MTTLNAPVDLCAGTPATPIVTGCIGNSRVQWTVLEKPAGSQVIFSDDTSELSTIDVTADGAYKIQLCCYFDKGVTVASMASSEPAIGCPISVTAGTVASISLTGCDDETITWAVSGAATFALGGSASGTSVPTDVNTTGAVTVTATCTRFDIDGNEITQVLECGFDVVAEEFGEPEYAEPFAVSVIQCGQTCLCDDATFLFSCEETTCQTAQIGLVFKDCPECKDPEPCEPLKLVPLGFDEAGNRLR